MLTKGEEFHKLSGNDDDDIQDKSKRASWKTCVGLFCIFATIMTWVFMSEYLQDSEYVKNHVILMRCLVDCVSIFSAIFAFVMEHWLGHRSKRDEGGRSFFWKTAPWTFAVCWGLCFWRGYFWYLSLQQVTASLTNSLYQVQCVFVYILSVIILGTKLTIRKSAATILALSGVFLIAFYREDEEEETYEDTVNDGNIVQGVMLILLAAFFYAVFKVLIKFVELKFYDEDHMIRDSQYFLGYTGIWSILASPLVVYSCHLLGWEHFDLPPDLESVYIILQVCGLSFTYKVTCVLSVLFMTPYACSMGLILVIPGSYVADFLFGKMETQPGWIQLGGVMLIIVGFLVLKLKKPKC